jgi:hypothetical protein
MTQHDTTCPDPDGSACRCGPDVQCPAVLVDGDGGVWRCTLAPGHGPTHESDWGWTDPAAGVTYTVEGER